MAQKKKICFFLLCFSLDFARLHSFLWGKEWSSHKKYACEMIYSLLPREESEICNFIWLEEGET